jgi:hypothetical protein
MGAAACCMALPLKNYLGPPALIFLLVLAGSGLSAGPRA